MLAKRISENFNKELGMTRNGVVIVVNVVIFSRNNPCISLKHEALKKRALLMVKMRLLPSRHRKPAGEYMWIVSFKENNKDKW